MDWKKANKYIPKELKDDFKMHMQNYIMRGIQTFEKKHELSITEKLSEMDEKEPDELKEYLRRKLFTKAEKDIQYGEPKYETVDEAIEYCKQTFRFIDCEKNKSKKYYFELGKALFKIKETYDSKKDFINDMEEKLGRKKSVLYKYLAFFNICVSMRDFDILNSSLKFEEIISNKKILEEFQSTGN